jgi:hypothetical protein
MRLAVILLLSLVPPSAVMAQVPHERLIRGLVLSATDGTPLEGILVLSLAGSRAHSNTAPSGRFALRVPEQGVRILATGIGFTPDTLEVMPGADVVTFRLREAAVTLDPLMVTAEPAFSAASSRALRELDIRLRPRETAQELLRLAPGLVIAQHAGGGKAEQIFLRGLTPITAPMWPLRWTGPRSTWSPMDTARDTPTCTS